MLDISIFNSQWSWLLMALAGLIMAFNPCMLAMTPLAAGYVGRQGEPGILKKLLVSLFFVLGFAGMLAVLGFGAGSLGERLGGAYSQWSYIMALIYALMGVYLLRLHHVVPIKIYGFYHGVHKRKGYLLPKPKGIFGAVLLGGIFGLTPAPCITPVVAAVLAYVVPTANPLHGASLLFAYGLGHGLPLFLGGTLGGMLGLGKIGRLWEVRLRPAAGIILILLAIYFLFWGEEMFFGKLHS